MNLREQRNYVALILIVLNAIINSIPKEQVKTGRMKALFSLFCLAIGDANRKSDHVNENRLLVSFRIMQSWRVQ